MGYGRLKPRVDAFLGSIGSLNSPVRGTHRISGIVDDGFAYRQPYILTPGSPYGYHRLAQLPSCVTPVNTLTAPAWGRALDRPASPRRDPLSRVRTLSTTGLAWTVFRRYGNINPLSIDYACRPRLRSRLTLGGLAWPRNPWSFGGQGSHLPYRYSCLHSHSHTLHSSITRLLHWMQDAPLPNQQKLIAAASAVCLSPATLSAHNHLTSELLRTLSRVAASKPTSWLSMRLHILFHLAHA